MKSKELVKDCLLNSEEGNPALFSAAFLALTSMSSMSDDMVSCFEHFASASTTFSRHFDSEDVTTLAAEAVVGMKGRWMYDWSLAIEIIGTVLGGEPRRVSSVLDFNVSCVFISST